MVHLWASDVSSFKSQNNGLIDMTMSKIRRPNLLLELLKINHES